MWRGTRRRDRLFHHRDLWPIGLVLKDEARFLHSETAKNAVPPVGMTGCVVGTVEDSNPHRNRRGRTEVRPYTTSARRRYFLREQVAADGTRFRPELQSRSSVWLKLRMEEKRRQAAALQSERWRANKRTAPRLSEAPLTKTKLLGKRVK